MRLRNVRDETVLRVSRQAIDIPDSATVTKPQGNVTYTLRHTLKVYMEDSPATGSFEIAGTFLVSEHGQITQVPADRSLLWHVPAEELLQALSETLDGDDEK